MRLRLYSMLIISIHTSPKGGDAPWGADAAEQFQFQSTPPRREVTIMGPTLRTLGKISIHTSPKGGDRLSRTTTFHWPISIHTSPKGGDGHQHRGTSETGRFQSTPPRREVT